MKMDHRQNTCLPPLTGTLEPPMFLVAVLSLGTFIIFFQGFMVAPILPGLSAIFKVSIRHASFIEPAYLLGYGSATLVYGPLSDKYGRFPVILFSLTCFIVLTACTGFCHSITQMILLRLLTGIGSGGVAPITIGWIGDRFAYERRGHALGIFFGCMAGGTALGSSVGALLTAGMGWQMLFWTVAAAGVLVLMLLMAYRRHFRQGSSAPAGGFATLCRSVKEILLLPRGWRTYLFVLFNGMFHSGVFAWAGYFFYRYHHLNERHVGLALLGYGLPGLLPGLLLGPLLGRLADKYGRNRIIPMGMLTGALSAILLSMHYSLAASCMFMVTLSFGFELTHPLFAAIITTLSTQKGAATGLFAFFLFMGYGLGSLVLSLIVNMGLDQAFRLFGVFALAAAGIAVAVFKAEK
ncbi:MFS transporter [Taibaiella koreensis]|uniref:MFS transporter n=1 Tax=Taibaiella koreensis TaxID=1268548 RepID=UPI0019699AC2|nr:MFS transporter [Taibaiella koreensis]